MFVDVWGEAQFRQILLSGLIVSPVNVGEAL